MSKKLLKLLLITATAALYLIVIKPLYTGTGGVLQPEKSIKTLRLLNAQYEDTLGKADGLISQANTLKAQYGEISEEKKATMAVMVPDTIDKVRLLSEVRSIAETAGFALKEISYSEGVVSSTGVASVLISFSVKTSYSQFKLLMDKFEKSMRLFSIESVSFGAPEKEDELTTYQIRLKTYYLK